MMAGSSSYNGELPKWNLCRLKPVNAPFGSHCPKKPTQKKYNLSISNFVRANVLATTTPITTD